MAKKVNKPDLVRLDEMEVEVVPINSILPNDYNPNRQDPHEFEMLCRSMEEDGFTQPLLVTTEGIIIDGEHRWRAARAIGLTEVPIVRSPMGIAQAKVSTIRHNRARGTHQIGDEAGILQELATMGAEDWAADSLMIDDATMKRMIADIPKAADFNVDIPKNGTPQQITEAVDHAREVVRQQVEQDQLAARTRAAAEAGQFRIMLMFAGDEAVLVKKVLGKDKVARILYLCRKYGDSARAESSS